MVGAETNIRSVIRRQGNFSGNGGPERYSGLAALVVSLVYCGDFEVTGCKRLKDCRPTTAYELGARYANPAMRYISSRMARTDCC